MSLLPCSNCNKRPRGKLATLYLAWFSGSSRVSKKLRLGPECVGEYAEYIRTQNALPAEDDTVDWPSECGSCKTPTADNFDPTYINVFMPKMEMVALVLPQCSECAAVARAFLSTGSEDLPDRNAQSKNGLPTTATDTNAFADIQWRI